MDLSLILCKPYPPQFREKKKDSKGVKKPSNQKNNITSKNAQKNNITSKNRPILPCCNCGYSILSKDHGSLHALAQEKPHRCVVCFHRFGSVTDLVDHEAENHDIKEIFKCIYTTCHERYASRWERDEHEIRVHKKRRPYACSYRGCNGRFVNQSNRRRHEQTLHGMAYNVDSALTHPRNLPYCS